MDVRAHLRLLVVSWDDSVFLLVGWPRSTATAESTIDWAVRVTAAYRWPSGKCVESGVRTSCGLLKLTNPVPASGVRFRVPELPQTPVLAVAISFFQACLANGASYCLESDAQLMGDTNQIPSSTTGGSLKFFLEYLKYDFATADEHYYLPPTYLIDSHKAVRQNTAAETIAYAETVSYYFVN